MQKSSVHFGKTRDRQGSFTERFSLREIKKENREEIMKPKNMLLTLDTCLEQEKTGRKTGLLVTALMNGLTMTGVEIVDEDDVAVDMQAFAKEKLRMMRAEIH